MNFFNLWALRVSTEPLNPWKRRGKTLKKQRNPRRGKKQGIPKKQGKEGQGNVQVHISSTRACLKCANTLSTFAYK